MVEIATRNDGPELALDEGWQTPGRSSLSAAAMKASRWSRKSVTSTDSPGSRAV